MISFFNLGVLSFPQFLLDEVDQVVVDDGAVGKPHAGTGRQLVEEEQLLLATQSTMITLLSSE
jgi:hypothetical protein